MSQISTKLANIIKSNFRRDGYGHRRHEPGESVSSRSSRGVGDSARTIEGQCITNIATGTFSGLVTILTLGFGLVSNNSVYADDSLTVSISGSPTITVSPGTEGTFADSGNINISVSNAPSAGYTLSITGSSTSLTGKTDDTKSITSIGFAIDQDTFNSSSDYNNKWGYRPSMHYDSSTEQRASNTNYLPSPDDDGDIIDITDDDASNIYTLSIGARVTNALGFQTYENNTFVIAATPNVLPVLYMQDIDSWKDKLKLNETVEAVDNRDENTYTVSKLADGNIWMTQNLRLGDTSKSLTLTSDDTDLDDGNSYTLPVAESSISNWGNDTTESTINASHVYNPGDTSTGNYYNWYTATAGNGTMTALSSYQSICPKGWTLPSNAEQNGLVTALGGADGSSNINILTDAPFSFPLDSGLYEEATRYNHSAIWSSDSLRLANKYETYFLDIKDSSIIQTTKYWTKNVAINVRCIFSPTFTVNLDANDGAVEINSITGTVGKIMSLLPTPTRDGYNFVGWYSSPQGGEKINATMLANGVTEYYARWGTTVEAAFEEAGKSKLSGYYKMQDIVDVCDIIPYGVTGSLIDVRDETVYTVGRFSDDNCWMLDNLRLDPTSANVTAENTNAPTEALDVYLNGGTAAETGWTSTKVAERSGSGFNSYTDPQFNSGSKDVVPNDSISTSGGYKIGFYYNYCAASAGTVCQSSSYVEAVYDICPSGWRMANYAEFMNLALNYASIPDFRTAFHIPLSGRYAANTGATFGQGTYGFYWAYGGASNSSYPQASSGFAFTASGFDGAADYRSSGDSLRCVSK